MRAETSPVNAPSSSQWTFCAATANSVPASSWTATARETYGGQTTTSTAGDSVCSRNATQNSAVSAGPLNIFQLPAISIQRDGIAATLGSSLPSSSSSAAPPP